MSAGGCWEWTGALQTNGYGSFGRGGRRTTLAHRWSYEHFVGPIPSHLEIDHLCRNRRCVRPDHLEPVTALENMRRGVSVPAKNRRKTHCLKGHPLSGTNLYLKPDGRRQCRRCQREIGLRAYDRGHPVVVRRRHSSIRHAAPAEVAP